ncbi:MAG: trypsin-like peptidase domain-containing protein [Limnochordaceae bacterium]|nr:trypsin-like peptidase domain-containing protein [Limnochordaceae bacterium]
MERWKRSARWRRLSGLALLAMLSFLAGAFLTTNVLDVHLWAQSSPAPPVAPGASAPASDAVLAQAPGIGNPYLLADIAEQVSPAVVFVQAKFPKPQVVRDPFFEFWFGPMPAPQAPVSAGTGFIISEDGYILTNQHVVGSVGDNQKLTVKLDVPNFTAEVPAKLVGSSFSLDLAVLKIDKPKGLDRLPVVKLGDSDKTRPGEWVIAIGNPYGEQLEHTVTVGVVSAKGRQIEVPDQEAGRMRRYDNLLQTDAAINPGNSGGPLVNIRGEVIGINTAINAQGQNIGFAIPINAAKKVLNDLITRGGIQVVRPYMGVGLEDLTPRMAGYLGLPDTDGALVNQVEPGSPADKAGLKVYDVIRRMGQARIRSANDVISELGKYKPKQQVPLQVWRDGRTVTLVVELGERTVQD